MTIIPVNGAMPEGRVGSKGELFPPKEIRDQAGLAPSKRVNYRVERGKLIVEVLPTIEELLDEAADVEITLAEFKKDRRELSTRAET